ncbi:MAG: bifunctional adenosylcobinamide kinase/adenosylcobinamide-phosphate guanylyltransferase [Campylobacterota bacterium]|nr:bifunctional adenosylcobinamide kinase/adenosylcobinamide-phosphate guanylyltransferase [Campylobacterota bacterium]
MLALFIGGIKSGKSRNAEEYSLNYSKNKPIYLATNEFFDDEMQERVLKHKEQRCNNFITIEEHLSLVKTISSQDSLVLVECISMWINNMLHHGYSEDAMIQQIQQIEELGKDIVFVINDVSCSVVSENKLVRKFVDINGRISQLLASKCEEVYTTTAGISIKIK